MNLEVEAFVGELTKLRDEHASMVNALKHSMAERTGFYFICGEAGEKDALGLPDAIFICPSYGSDGMAIYKKAKEYSAPEY